ncbi:unnamed protein product [Malus baccata var. baccata]
MKEGAKRKSSERERGREIEESIRSLCKGVASFCNHFHSSCDALKTSVDRRPIPLDTASSNFLNPSTAASTQLNLLETMSFGTVSFEELLGHCCEVQGQPNPPPPPPKSSLPLLQLEIDEDDFERTPVVQEEGFYAPVIDEEEDLLDESLSLKKLGLSDASLATLQCMSFKSFKGSYDASTNTSGAPRDGLLSDFGEVEDKPKLAEVPLPLVKVSRDDYESLPSYMKSLAPWEDLVAAVEKINSSLKQKARGNNFFHQDEISSLGLGKYRAESEIFAAACTHESIVETVNGLILYQVL